MNFLGVIVMMLTAVQGEAVQLQVPSEPDLVALEAVWNDRRVPFVKNDAGWFTVVGVDLEMAPGEHVAELQFTYADGRIRRELETLNVQSKAFPETRLTVEPKYVELSAENQARATREREEIDAIYASVTPDAYWRGI